jgi:prevent-host-death family protein
MKRASISETKNRLSALLDRVRQGQTVIIEDRGLPVARLEPIVAAGTEPEGRLARLERQGIVRRTGSATLRSSFFRTRPPRRAGKRAASAILIDERREGR